MSAYFLKHHQKIYYWGDLDSEGLNILSMVRQKIPDVIPLMMDEVTILQFEDKMVDEPDSVFSEPQYLTAEELILFRHLRSNIYKNKRLEQERISNEWINLYLKAIVLK
ncbi:hypothetical protein F926_02743 [Acinetobacter haemolyticus NIPH 261]|nr:Wadjet anti-phage system protein JetD domain-containing protein [Acinetobacter haemolyticus]ENW19182.1 hypothetical protein F926_02743 [Acinetobacter haemolyticus NIPH 261]